MAGPLTESTASIRWLTHPPEGTPRLSIGSRSFNALTVAVDDDAPHPLAASPGELMAGAFGSIFSWLLAEDLVDAGAQARELVVEVALSANLHGLRGSEDAVLREISCHAEVRVRGIDTVAVNTICVAAMKRTGQAMGLRDDVVDLRVDCSVVGA